MTTMDASKSTSITLEVDTTSPPENPFGNWTFEAYGQRLFVASMCTLITISGIFGNSLVILSVFASRKLRNATNVFVVNLAIADLATCVFLFANVIALVSPDEWPWPESELICKLSAGILMTSVGVSLYNLAVISFNRYILIVKSVKEYQKFFGSTRNLVIWGSFVWIIPILVINVPLLLGPGEVGYNRKYHSCSDKSDSETEHLYDIIQGLGLFPLPLITVVVCYIKIYRHVLTHAKKLVSREDSEVISTNQSMKKDDNTVNDDSVKPNLPTSSSSHSISKSTEKLSSIRGTLKKSISTSLSIRSLSTSSELATSKRGRRNRSIKSYLSKRQIEITKNLFYVLCAFLVCITPYLLTLLVDDNAAAPAVPYTATLLMLNSCINWIIYATKHPHFKTVFKCILLCKWDSIPEPADWVRKKMWLHLKIVR